jgi:hypothetical protein
MKGPGPGSGTLAGHTLFPSLEPAGGLDAHMFIASPSGFAFCDEASLNIYDRDFALEMTSAFADDLAGSERCTWEAWRARPLRERIAEQFIRPFRSQL